MDKGNWWGMRVLLPFEPGGMKEFRLHPIFFRGPQVGWPFYYYVPLPSDRDELRGILADLIINEGIEPPELLKEYHERKRERDAAFGDDGR